eukprot:SAG11_NODE_21_length_25065_cov_3.589081_3_plen_67_part_00
MDISMLTYCSPSQKQNFVSVMIQIFANSELVLASRSRYRYSGYGVLGPTKYCSIFGRASFFFMYLL